VFPGDTLRRPRGRHGGGPLCAPGEPQPGCKAVFLLGGSPAPTPVAMLLRSGDVVLMAGCARSCFHGSQCTALVLYCTVLYCTVMYCIVLCCYVVLCYIVLFCTVQCSQDAQYHTVKCTKVAPMGDPVQLQWATAICRLLCAPLSGVPRVFTAPETSEVPAGLLSPQEDRHRVKGLAPTISADRPCSPEGLLGEGEEGGCTFSRIE